MNLGFNLIHNRIIVISDEQGNVLFAHCKLGPF